MAKKTSPKKRVSNTHVRSSEIREPVIFGSLHAFIQKANSSNIFGDHLRNAPDSIENARGAVQQLVKVDLPKMRLEAEQALPDSVKHSVCPLLGEIESAAWDLMDAIDGKSVSEIIKDRRMVDGPWVVAMKKIDRLTSRAGFLLAADRRLQGFHESSDDADADFRTIQAFPTEIHSRIRQAALPERKNMRVRKRNLTGQQVEYSYADALKWWPSDLATRDSAPR